MSIFYEVIAPNGKKNYLFGTMHVNDDDILKLPVEVKEAFDNATTFICESDVDKDFLQNLFSQYDSQFTEWYKDWIYEAKKHRSGEVHYQFLQAAKEYYKKTYDTASDRDCTDAALETTPIYFALQVAENLFEKKINNSNKPVLDVHLLRLAKKVKKSAHFLESVDEAKKIMYGLDFSYPEHLEFYAFIMSFLSRGKKVPRKNDIKSAYLEQDLLTLKKLSQPFSLDNTPSVVRKYYQNFYDVRDNYMTSKLKIHFNEGNAFAAVGAAHLLGITKRLSREGFIINPITLRERYHSSERISAFKNIYNALYAGQSSLFKTKSSLFDGKMDISINDINQYILKKPNSRTAKAWQLTNEHFPNVNCENIELVKAIHQYSFLKSSSFYFFKQSENFSNGNYEGIADKIRKANPNSRTGNIFAAFSGSDCSTQPRPL